MTDEEASKLPEGTEVIFIGNRSDGHFIKYATYAIGGDYYRRDKKYSPNKISVVADSKGIPNGWKAEYFILSTPASRLLYKGK